MDTETFNKVEKLIQAISAIHPNIFLDDPKQEKLYIAMHELKQVAEDRTGRKIQFKTR